MKEETLYQVYIDPKICWEEIYAQNEGEAKKKFLEIFKEILEKNGIEKIIAKKIGSL